MLIECIVHADFETPGVIADWAALHGHTLSIVKPFNGEEPKGIHDFLIVMGGPQSPLQLEQAPYLKKEITLIQKYISSEKPILGFCLGAQLIGESLGGKTEQSPEKEVGVFPLELTTEGTLDPLLADCPQTFNVIHWHNDMPGLVSDSVVLAKSTGCPRQIVRFKPQVYGFQCHLEITREGIEAMIEACPNDLQTSKFTQSKADLLKNDYYLINKMMDTLLDRLIKLR